MTNIIAKPPPPRRGTPSNTGVITRVAAKIAAGETVKAACAAAGVTVPTYYRWRASTRPAADPRSGADNRDAILDAAKKLFLREGFGVSMNKLATTAGVARQTLFNRFGSKEKLFRAVIHRIFERMMRALVDIKPNNDFATTLTVYARQYLEIAYDPEGIALHRLTIAEVREFPDLAKLVQALGVSRAVPMLAKHLRDRMDTGEIRRCDPEITAECFLACVTGHSRHRAIMGTDTDRSGRIEARLQASVEMFVRGLRHG